MIAFYSCSTYLCFPPKWWQKCSAIHLINSSDSVPGWGDLRSATVSTGNVYVWEIISRCIYIISRTNTIWYCPCGLIQLLSQLAFSSHPFPRSSSSSPSAKSSPGGSTFPWNTASQELSSRVFATLWTTLGLHVHVQATVKIYCQDRSVATLQRKEKDDSRTRATFSR